MSRDRQKSVTLCTATTRTGTERGWLERERKGGVGIFRSKQKTFTLYVHTTERIEDEGKISQMEIRNMHEG